MTGFVVRRLLQTLLTAFVVSIAVFSMIHLATGEIGPFAAGEQATRLEIEIWEERLGVDKPLHVQYALWLSRMVRGDMGQSWFTGRPVSGDVGRAFRVTLVLSAVTFVVVTIGGLVLGVVAATRPNTTYDLAVMLLATAGFAIPAFWLGLMLIQLFGVRLGWLPTFGWGTPRHMVLPVATMGLSSLALIARMTRSTILEALVEDYVRTARAKGLSGRIVVWKHAMRNAMLPVVTVIGLRLGHLLTGSVITETVFAVPGLGRLIVSSISDRDIPVLQGGVMFVTMIFIAVNTLVDLVYGFLDPRVRIAG